MAIVHLSAILDPEARARALWRIGYFDDTKKQGRQVDYRRLLDWFVALSRKNLATMSPAALLELREEVRALQEEGSGGVTLTEDDASTAAHLLQTQRTVAQYLEQLTTTGRIEFEEFKLSPSILLPRFRPGETAAYKYPIYVGESVDPLHGKGLLFLFFWALKGAGDRLRQCQHCARLFVQARRKQQFCAPRCRMRDLRARQQKEREKREKRKTSRRLRQKKGAQQHGPKKHR
jgi:hypothetical protein